MMAVFPSFVYGQTSAASRSCRSTVTGDLEIVPLVSKVYGNERKLRIWLPPGYNDAEQKTATYPVLYMFDGSWLFDQCTAPPTQGEWKVDETLTELIEKHQAAPLIVVGIDSNEHRDSEYAPYGNPLFFGPPKALQGAQVPEFLTEDVQPYVAAHYRVKKGRENTGVGGSSLGGVAALIALLRRPDIFGIGLLESTAMQYGNGQLLRDVTPVVVGPVRVSIGVGTQELGPDAKMLGVPNFDEAFVSLNRTLAENFKAAIANHPEVLFTVQEGGRHGAAAWRDRFPAAIQFLYPPTKK
ncbi:MAG TPA: alpha/beta hydrolase-fold protein [Edaphobacter sp.]|nr:alpha/beta hydrolase-fold protein [Edaphobacter sp.]